MYMNRNTFTHASRLTPHASRLTFHVSCLTPATVFLTIIPEMSGRGRGSGHVKLKIKFYLVLSQLIRYWGVIILVIRGDH